jgi:(p)ppGpp synthase/HD superfamily hydrolase
MATLERAIQIAVQAHAGQKDKMGIPYILHPLHLMFKMRSDPERIAAVLHDVVEDSDWTIERLRDEGFSDEVLVAVDHLTRRTNEPYENFIERVDANSLARTVKIADLLHNLDASRIPKLTDKDIARIRKYQKALAVLTDS